MIGVVLAWQSDGLGDRVWWSVDNSGRRSSRLGMNPDMTHCHSQSLTHWCNVQSNRLVCFIPTSSDGVVQSDSLWCWLAKIWVVSVAPVCLIWHVCLKMRGRLSFHDHFKIWFSPHQSISLHVFFYYKLHDKWNLIHCNRWHQNSTDQYLKNLAKLNCQTRCEENMVHLMKTFKLKAPFSWRLFLKSNVCSQLRK